MALSFLHGLLGVVACRKQDLAGKREVFELLDPVLDRRGIPQHVQARAIGHDIDLYGLAFFQIMFEDVRRVIQREIHDCRIILIDLNRNPMHLCDTFRRFCIARKTRRDQRHRHQGRDRQQTKKAAHQDAPLNSRATGFDKPARGTRIAAEAVVRAHDQAPRCAIVGKEKGETFVRPW